MSKTKTITKFIGDTAVHFELPINQAKFLQNFEWDLIGRIDDYLTKDEGLDAVKIIRLIADRMEERINNHK